MNECLYHLCRHCVCLMDGWHPYPARLIAEQAGVSLYKARKMLRELKSAGYVDTMSYVLDEESHLPYRGWTITSKAYETEEYKKAMEVEAEIIEKCFGIPKEQFLKSLEGDQP